MPRPVGFTLEDEGAKKKWDAWKREQGISKTEAKRQYISFLIETMSVYASGTLEARELLGELEYLWDQIKDLDFDDNEDPNVVWPPSPLVAQLDRYSTMTPLPLPSNYSGKNNLQKIYSHSRRSTMLSINDYVRQQSQAHAQSHAPPITHILTKSPLVPIKSISNSNPYSNEDFKTWQGEINLIINKLSKEFMSNRNRDVSDSESELEPVDRLKRQLWKILKLVGFNIIRMAKSFSISVLAILFIVWCFKRNVIVKRTIVRTPQINSSKKTEELVINMILNTDENKWFIRMLNFINSFVGFV